MSQTDSSQQSPPKGSVNSACSPAYWGSFLSVVVCLFLMMIGAVLMGPPTYLGHLPADTALALYISSALVVSALTLRYYIATSVSCYGDGSSAFHALHRFPRTVIFIIFSLLVALCNIAAGILSTFSVVGALRCCLLMSIFSFICWLVSWVTIRRSAEQGPSRLFGCGDCVISIMVYCTADAALLAMDSSTVTMLAIVAVAVWIFMFHEYITLYSRRLRSQVGELESFLRE